MEKVWNPHLWGSDFDYYVSQVKEGDVIRNPVYEDNCKEMYDLAQRVDDALKVKGLKVDHTQLCVGYVEKIS